MQPIPEEEVIQAIRDSEGSIYDASLILQCPAQQIHDMALNRPAVQEALEESRREFLRKFRVQTARPAS